MPTVNGLKAELERLFLPENPSCIVKVGEMPDGLVAYEISGLGPDGNLMIGPIHTRNDKRLDDALIASQTWRIYQREKAI